MRIVADNKIPFLKGVFEPFADIEYYPWNGITASVVKNADALIIRTRTKCDINLLAGSKVRFIATATIGYDHIDTIYCDNNGISWVNAPGSNSSSVMQYMASALYSYAFEKNIDLHCRVLGVIGAGNVGKKVIRLAESIGMTVIINDPPRQRSEGSCGFISMEGLLREADIITLHVPLIKEGEDRTFHLIDDQFIKKLNNDTLIINSSRGEVIDTNTLKKSIGSGRLKDAILDVWENEPNIDTELLQKVFIGTPHIAGYSLDGKANATTIVVNAVSRFFNLELTDWEVFDIPEPENKVIHYNAKNKSLDEIFTELIKISYDVRIDDTNLRLNPQNFENYRGNYPLRREFGAYQMIIENLREDHKVALLRAGFKIN